MNSTIRLVLSTAAALGLLLAPAAGRATTPTPSPTPEGCVSGELHPAELRFELSVEPPHPQVGDDVVLTVKISTVSGGLFGIPQYMLSGTTPFFTGDTSPRSGQFGPTDQVYELHAVQAGTAQVVMFVSYETSVGCVETPIFYFTSGRSDPLVVEIGAGTPETPSATPTPTATPPPQTCVGDCNGDGEVSISEIITGVNIGLALAPFDACAAFDRNGDQSITVDELVAGVQSGLSGCVAAPVCTPPPCSSGEVFHCPGQCPGGCGTECATPTPTAEPSSFCQSFCDECRGCDLSNPYSLEWIRCNEVCDTCQFECGGI